MRRRSRKLTRSRSAWCLWIIPQVPGYEIDAAWRPARSVGGDYFDVLKFNEKSLAVCIGDVTGKGIPAALLMSNLQATVRGFAGPHVQPSDLCARVNRADSASGRRESLHHLLLRPSRRTRATPGLCQCGAQSSHPGSPGRLVQPASGRWAGSGLGAQLGLPAGAGGTRSRRSTHPVYGRDHRGHRRARRRVPGRALDCAGHNSSAPSAWRHKGKDHGGAPRIHRR